MHTCEHPCSGDGLAWLKKPSEHVFALCLSCPNSPAVTTSSVVSCRLAPGSPATNFGAEKAYTGDRHAKSISRHLLYRLTRHLPNCRDQLACVFLKARRKVVPGVIETTDWRLLAAPPPSPHP